MCMLSSGWIDSTIQLGSMRFQRRLAEQLLRRMAEADARSSSTGSLMRLPVRR